MSRDPYAKSLRTKPQQVIPDKRAKSYRDHLNEAIAEGVPEWADELLGRLK